MGVGAAIYHCHLLLVARRCSCVANVPLTKVSARTIVGKPRRVDISSIQKREYRIESSKVDSCRPRLNKAVVTCLKGSK